MHRLNLTHTLTVINFKNFTKKGKQMAEKTLNTIIVLRNDHEGPKFGTAESNVILRPGELGVHYLENGNVMVKMGDGTKSWNDLPQVEAVLENDIMLTYTFGRHSVTAGSSKNAGGKDMTFSEWFQDALKVTTNPTVVQPSANLRATPSGDSITYNSNDQKYYGEVGAYITSLSWDGSTSNGTYKVGSGADQGTGISSSDFSWAVSNNKDAQTSSSQDSSFTLASDKYIQIDTHNEKTYATISATVTLDPSKAKNPKDNLGGDVPSLKITGFDTAGTKTKDLSASVKASGFYKPFWTVKAAAANLKKPTAYTSDDVRDLANSANSTKGFPTTLTVPQGSEQVVFFAKASTYSTLVAKDSSAMNAPVTFTKVANALKVKGANGFAPAGTDGFDYDLWYVDWNPDSVAGYTGIGSAKELILAWS